MTSPTRLITSIVTALVAVAATAVLAQSDEADRIKESAKVLDEIMQTGDKAVPTSILGKAAGIAVIPGTIKGGFIVGGQHGRGILSGKNKAGAWSPPAFITLTGGSVGLQIGGSATDIILVVQNERGLENLIRNEFKIGAGAAVAGGPVGREASASTDAQLKAEILSYSRSSGAFAGVTLEGSTIKEDKDANGRYYGTKFATREVVLDGKAKAPDTAGVWFDALKKYASAAPAATAKPAGK
jgi:lipid-binding SYLF domain-containing protein